MTFDSFELSPRVLQGVQDLGFSEPTPVQREALPPGLEGRDVLASAATGSGKTAAFALPILERFAGGNGRGPRALILSPTRELAMQTEEHLSALGAHTGVRSAAVFGGVSAGPQERAFRKGVEVIVATPGRLLDHLQNNYASLDTVEILVVDEADRMLDMGFLPDVRRILKHLPARRQTLFFSATMPPAIVKLSKEMLRDPVTVALQKRQAPASGITQAVYPVAAELKAPLLLELLRRNEIGNAIVFCRTKHRANRLFELLERDGISVVRIHGNRSQAARTDALDGFKSGRYRVLVGTDIVARGIDVEALEHVINFDVPHVPEDYIHRVGRTARAEETGDAYTLVSQAEEKDLRAIERAIGKSLERIKVKNFDYSAKADQPLEVPLKERIARIRAEKAAARERTKLKAERKAQREGAEAERRAKGEGPKPGGSGKSKRRRRRPARSGAS